MRINCKSVLLLINVKQAGVSFLGHEKAGAEMITVHGKKETAG
jgi:hypothetical protein